MNPKIKSATLRRIQSSASSKRFRIATLTENKCTIPIELGEMGHTVLTLGSRFRKLYAISEEARKRGEGELLIAECSRKDLPLAPGRLDAIVLCDDLLVANTVSILKNYRQLLKPTGILVWPHPTAMGFRSKVNLPILQYDPRKAGNTWRNTTAQLMEAGFHTIEQVSIDKRGVNWTVTSGVAGHRPWRVPGPHY